ncbi:E3 ubiquitin-protein ligase RNF181 [Copidosoma floridanum]|uniref:E3 ubiquitin-protein ligase RNF181 n=1 Tax=Copidosoma floridanum TaxID=29053 RepID=UPI0006C97788|nr:E3 ubiquitin-protein ligase RNF181 [Copidosoma floridanum]XP_014217228.1 E3 ubiquitin-protein ligase RNF181 [Copidosoma floridanum]
MAGYFEEMGWTPLGNAEAPNHLIQMARFLRDSGMWDLLGEQERLPPPASKEAVQSLEEVEFKGDNEKKGQCPVCLKEFEKGITAKLMPCKHTFHKECIEPWLEKTNSCPLCRHELPTDDEDYEDFKKEKKRRVERKKDLEVLHDSMFT